MEKGERVEAELVGREQRGSYEDEPRLRRWLHRTTQTGDLADAIEALLDELDALDERRAAA